MTVVLALISILVIQTVIMYSVLGITLGQLGGLLLLQIGLNMVTKLVAPRQCKRCGSTDIVVKVREVK